MSVLLGVKLWSLAQHRKLCYTKIRKSLRRKAMSEPTKNELYAEGNIENEERSDTEKEDDACLIKIEKVEKFFFTGSVSTIFHGIEAQGSLCDFLNYLNSGER